MGFAHAPANCFTACGLSVSRPFQCTVLSPQAQPAWAGRHNSNAGAQPGVVAAHQHIPRLFGSSNKQSKQPLAFAGQALTAALSIAFATPTLCAIFEKCCYATMVHALQASPSTVCAVCLSDIWRTPAVRLTARLPRLTGHCAWLVAVVFPGFLHSGACTRPGHARLETWVFLCLRRQA